MEAADSPEPCIGMLGLARGPGRDRGDATPIGELSGATGTNAFGPSPWTAAATTGAKPPIANPICVPIVMRDAAHRC